MPWTQSELRRFIRNNTWFLTSTAATAIKRVNTLKRLDAEYEEVERSIDTMAAILTLAISMQEPSPGSMGNRATAANALQSTINLLESDGGNLGEVVARHALGWSSPSWWTPALASTFTGRRVGGRENVFENELSEYWKNPTAWKAKNKLAALKTAQRWAKDIQQKIDDAHWQLQRPYYRGVWVPPATPRL